MGLLDFLCPCQGSIGMWQRNLPVAAGKTKPTDRAPTRELVCQGVPNQKPSFNERLYKKSSHDSQGIYIYGWQVKHVESIWILSISRSKFPNLTVRCSRKVIHPVATRIGLRGWTGCLHSRTERRSGQLGLKASLSSSYCWWPSLCRTPFSWSHKQMPCSWWRGNCVLATRLLWWVKIRTGFWGNCWL